MNFVAIDFETANEQRDSACAIGLTVVRDGVADEPIYHLLRPPEMRFSYWNTQVHGIREADVVDAQTIGQLWPTILPLFEQYLIVAHNASFDMGVLRNSLLGAGLEIPSFRYLCSLKLSRKAWPGLPSYSLGKLAAAHGLKLQHHHAGSDSQASAELLLLAGRAKSQTCPLALAKSLRVSIGDIQTFGQRQNRRTPAARSKTW